MKAYAALLYEGTTLVLCKMEERDVMQKIKMFSLINKLTMKQSLLYLSQLQFSY